MGKDGRGVLCLREVSVQRMLRCVCSDGERKQSDEKQKELLRKPELINVILLWEMRCGYDLKEEM